MSAATTANLSNSSTDLSMLEAKGTKTPAIVQVNIRHNFAQAGVADAIKSNNLGQFG